MHEYTPILDECRQDEFEHQVDILAADWYEQLEESNVIYQNAPYGNEFVYESDVIKFAEQDGLYIPNAQENIPSILKFHARQHLEEGLPGLNNWRAFSTALNWG